MAGVRVVRVDKELICNPSYEEIEKADLNFIIAGSSDAIMMVEGGADIVPEDEVLAALMFGHDKIKEIINLQNQLVSDEIIKREFTVKEKDKNLEEKIVKSISSDLNEAIRVKLKQERSSKSSEAYQKAFDELSIEDDFNEKEFKEIFDSLKKSYVRNMMFDDKVRIDGRAFDQIRPISSEIKLLPRAHGSAVFTRGETQALVACTLGSKEDQQRVDTLMGEDKRRFMLHYNFPPFSVGEVSFRLGTGRREIGHGELAKRAVEAILPLSLIHISEPTRPY